MRLAFALLLAALTAACSRAQEPTREYTVVGQVLAVDRAQQEITIRHQDIKDFMPAMTMPFKVRETALLDGREPGDLVTATLVLGDTTAYLSSIERTGHAPVEVPLVAASGLREGGLVADASFVDERGNPRTLSDLRGHRVALTFIYSRCPVPDFCPLMNRRFAQVQKAVKARPDLADVRLLSVTLDPAYDTPEVLRAHARVYEADPAIWSFFTGEPQVLAEFGAQFGLHSEAVPDDPAQLIHNLRTIVIAPDGRLVHNVTGNEWTPDDLLAQLTASAAID
jgi:protein SCO1/2